MKFSPYSPSRLESAVCGFSFFNTYGVAERPKSDSIASARGSAIHEIFERISIDRLAGKERIDETEINKYIVDAVAKFPSSYAEMTNILRMVRIYLRKLPQLEKHTRTEVMLAVNEKFEECEYDDPNAFIRGRADLLMFSDDGDFATLIDYKTQRNKEDADTFQLGVYAWILSKMYPFLKEISTILYFAQIGVASETYTWTKEDLKHVEQDIMNRINVVENRVEWTATANHKCTYCMFKLECPITKKYFEVRPDGKVVVKPNTLKIFGDYSKAMQILEFKAVVEPLVSEATSEMKDYVELNGPLAIFGKEFGSKTEVKPDWDKMNKNPALRDEFFSICERHGENGLNYMGFSATSANKVWLTGNQPLVEELSKVVPTKAEARTAWRKL